MNTLTILWHTQVKPCEDVIPEKEMREELKSWGCPEHLPSYADYAKAREVWAMKKTLMNELQAQFKNGTDANITAGRVCWNLPARSSSWPVWLAGVLKRKFMFDPVNNIFFAKHKSDRWLSKRYVWLLGLQSNPLSYFKWRYPIQYFRNWIHGTLSDLQKQLKADMTNMEIMGIDQPVEGEDGYFDIWGAKRPADEM